MNKLSIILFYVVGGLMLLGGIGDQFINELLTVHKAYLGNPPTSELYEKAQGLILLMLHSLGGGLMAAGVAILALSHFAVRKGEVWASWTILILALMAQGFNGYGMYKAGSYYWYPLLIILIVVMAHSLRLLSKD